MKGPLLAGAIALVGCFAAITATGGATPAKATATRTVHYYLALGDSLSTGYQPNRAGVGRETKQGYVDDIYAVAKQRIKNLKLVDIGCPGATTTSLLTGAGNAIAARRFHCDHTDGSQLKAAVAFLKSHSANGEISLITIDIGANDIDGCGTDLTAGEAAILACVEKGVKSIEINTPKILSALQRAAPAGTALAGMNLYDPILAAELSSDSSEANLGSLSLSLAQTVNAALDRTDAANGFKTANVAKAFDTYDTAPESVTGTPLGTATGLATIPTDVVNICDLTWMCAAPPVGPNIHANPAGYALIARAFEAVLPGRY